MKKPTIFISLSFSIAIRNFYETGVIRRLQEHFHVVVLVSPRIAETLRRRGLDREATMEVFDAGPEPRLWLWLRHFKKKIYMEGRRSTTEAIWEKYHQRPAYQRAGAWVVRQLICLINPIRLHGWWSRLEARLTRDDRLRATFARHQPLFTLLCITMHHPDEVVVRNCRALRVPMAYFVMSWDHLSAKIILHLDFARILVWNEHTRRETLRTYPWFTSEQVRVVGIPNYDAYAEPPARTREEWCRHYGLDTARRTILFSTMPQSRHEQQHIIIRRILDEIESGALPRDLQVLIKCHPFDNFTGYGAVIAGRPAALHQTTFAGKTGQDNWEPGPTEIQDSRDALVYCDVNINIFSTVTIEAAYFDKPIVSLAFDPLPIAPGRIPCREYYNWDHFSHIVEKGGTILVESYEALFAALRDYLDNPQLKARERRLLVEAYIGDRLGHGAEGVTRELLAFSESVSSPHSRPSA